MDIDKDKDKDIDIDGPIHNSTPKEWSLCSLGEGIVCHKTFLSEDHPDFSLIKMILNASSFYCLLMGLTMYI